MANLFEITIQTPVTLFELTKTIDNIESLGYQAGPIHAFSGYVRIDFDKPEGAK